MQVLAITTAILQHSAIANRHSERIQLRRSEKKRQPIQTVVTLETFEIV